ncbi:MAG: hypothetical protein DWQ02_15125 [Bacteroidetes bacterium]|nr:MAG: hypothetical protein DWQ02_15125 [Bacteroidota bacterium]
MDKKMVCVGCLYGHKKEKGSMECWKKRDIEVQCFSSPCSIFQLSILLLNYARYFLKAGKRWVWLCGED